MDDGTGAQAWREVPPARAPEGGAWTPPADTGEGRDGAAARVDAILNDCGATMTRSRDLLRPLARQAAALESDLTGRTEHDADYLRVLRAYEGTLKTLRQTARNR